MVQTRPTGLLAAASKAAQTTEQRRDNVDSGLIGIELGDHAAILELLREAYEDGSSQLRVVNLWYPQASDRTDQLGAALARSLPAVLSSKGRVPVIRLSLVHGSSRATTVADLCEQLAIYIKKEGLQSTQPEFALEAARSVLTEGRFIVVLEHWDNANGPLSALDHFLCDTNWSEFVRILVQPHRNAPIQRSKRSSSGSMFIALSSTAVSELAPWCKRVAQLISSPALGQVAAGLIKSSAQLTHLLSTNRPSFHFISRFVAASVDGMRRSTLKRCIRQWLSLFEHTMGGAVQPRVDEENPMMRMIDSDIDSFLRQYKLVVFESESEDGDRVMSEDIRHVELNWQPEAPHEGVAQDGKLLHFISREIRSQFVTAWIDGYDSAPNAPSWSTVNFVLAEESLRQATAQVSRGDNRERSDSIPIRRFSQTIYHGIMSLDGCLRGGERWLPMEGNLHAPSIPVESAKRFRYLYRFVYRRCVEGDEWRLGRSLGRSDVRLDLLTIFLFPPLALKLLRGPSANPSARLLPRLFSPEPPLPTSEVVLRCDMLKALARSGLDAGSQRGRDSAEWALSVLPGWRVAALLLDPTDTPIEKYEINRRLPRRGDTYARVSDDALKLRIDWLQSSADAKSLRQAKTLCLDQLERCGISADFVDELQSASRYFVERSWRGCIDPAKELRPILQNASDHLLGGDPSARILIMASDVLSRLGEILATAADNHVALGADATPDEPIFIFAWACAIYHVGDHVRSAAAAAEGDDLSWPTAGARALRYNVRACLKLARLLVAGAADPNDQTISKLADTLLIHAQARLATYTRHHYRFQRERGYLKLLESARIRTWVRVNSYKKSHAVAKELVHHAAHQFLANVALRTVQKGRQDSVESGVEIERWKKAQRVTVQDITIRSRELISYLESQCLILDQAQARLDEAETLLIALGHQRSHVRRLLLERAKLASTAVSILNVTLSLREARAVSVKGAGEYRVQPNLAMSVSLEALHRDLSLQLHELAKKQALEDRIRRGQAACEALYALSRGDIFWTGIADRQAQSLEFSLIKMKGLVDVEEDRVSIAPK